MSPLRWFVAPSPRSFFWQRIAAGIAVTICSLLSAATAAAQTPPVFSPDSIPTPAERPSALLGAAVYQQNCAACHGMTGAGEGPDAATLSVAPQPFNDAATVQQLAPAAAFHLAKFGSESGVMPGQLGFLNDAQLWQTVYYAWSLRTTDERIAAGAALYAAQCASCHGESGRGDGPEAGDDLQSDFTDQAVMIFRSPAALDAGWQGAHADLGADLSADARQDVLEAIRTFTYRPPWESPLPAGEGVIAGRLVQGSAGAEPPAAQEMTLMAYMSFTPVATFTATTTADGGFRFDQLATTPEVVYYVGTDYAGVAYGSDLFSLAPLTPTVQLEIPIYETTTAPDALRISRTQWVVDQLPGELRVRQVLLVANDQDRTIVGRPVDGAERSVTVALPVPANAVDLQFQDGALGARYQQIGDAVYDTTPIRPGDQSRQVLMGYTIPFTATDAAFTTEFAYPVDALTLLVADLPELQTEVSAPLEAVGNQTVQGVAYRVWNGQLDTAQAVTVALQNLVPAGESDPRLTPAALPAPILAAPPAAAQPTIPPLFAALGVGALVLVVGAGILYWKYSRDKQQTLQMLLDAKERLLSEIAILDDRHAQGELDDESWSAERLALMNSLRTVTGDIERHAASRKGRRSRG